jgi:hypothetical protein
MRGYASKSLSYREHDVNICSPSRIGSNHVHPRSRSDPGDRGAHNCELDLCLGREKEAVKVQPRRFPPPWSIGGNQACYWVEDAEGKQVAFIYFVTAAGHAGDVQKLTADEARRIARGIAKLPELLGR